MKRKNLKAITALALALTLSASAGAPAIAPVTTAQAAAKIKLNVTKKTLAVGKTLQLKLTGTKKSIKWTSSKKSVATVSQKGLVKAKSAGKATITATCSKKKYKCAVTVKKASAKITYKTETVDGFQFPYPSGWITQSDSTDAMTVFAAADDAENPKKMALFMCVPTGTEALDYDAMKTTFAQMFNEELLSATLENAGIQNVSISGMKTSDFKSAHGMCLQIRLHLKATENGQPMEGNCVFYVLSVDNYLIEAIGINETDSATAFLTTQTEAMLNGLVLPQ